MCKGQGVCFMDQASPAPTVRGQLQGMRLAGLGLGPWAGGQAEELAFLWRTL